jgi:hypothetical protein
MGSCGTPQILPSPMKLNLETRSADLYLHIQAGIIPLAVNDAIDILVR